MDVDGLINVRPALVRGRVNDFGSLKWPGSTGSETVYDSCANEMNWAPDLGSRRALKISILGRRGSYPNIRLRSRDAVFHASPSLVYTAVPAEEPNEYGFSEIAWANVGEIRWWGAIAFGIREGKGFYSFYPFRGRVLFARELDEDLVNRIAARAADEYTAQKHQLHRIQPSLEEIHSLYDALLHADNVLLRGVSCYLKAHLLSRHDLFAEEMGINLYIALEAGLCVLRRKLSKAAGTDVSYQGALDFVRTTFAYGDPLVGFWEDCRDHRNMLIHPDSYLGSYAMHPMSADHIWEMLDPMLSLYRYLLLGELRPTDL